MTSGAHAEQNVTERRQASAKKRVLIVEDQYLIRALLKVWVEAAGYEICGMALNAEDAVSLALEHRPEIILMDFRLEGEATGVDAALEIAGRYQPRIIYVTGSSEESTIARINEDHPFAILIKPVTPADLNAIFVKL